MKGTGRRVLVAMSGGVDSSAAVYLLREQGYDCVGATMELMGSSPENIEDARQTAGRLGISHHVLGFADAFEEKVVRRFVEAYERGETPNPCVDCNRFLKFGLLYQKARELGCDLIATGHYAQVLEDGAGGFRLVKGADPGRDQSYVLYPIPREQLAHTLFPLGRLSKAEVRAIAEREGFPNARKGDSQDICFVPDGDYAAFIRRYTGEAQPEGWFVDREGNPLGKHRGIGCYTIGQRKGLGIALGRPMFVQAIDPEKNTVTLVEDESLLYSRQVIAGDVNFLSLPKEEFYQLLPVRARVRYSQGLAEAQAVYLPDEERLRLWFREPQRAATPGQAVVLYQGNMVVCGGTILGSRGEEEEEPA